MKKPGRKQQAIMHDLGIHAAGRMQDALSDAMQLLDSQDAAYAFAVSVVGAVVCSLAKLRPDGEVELAHPDRIALVLGDLIEVMKMHRKHG